MTINGCIKNTFLFLILSTGTIFSQNQLRKFKPLNEETRINTPYYVLYGPQIYDGKLFGINFNSQSVVVWDLKQQREIRSISSRGEGPMETLNIGYYMVQKDSLKIIDNGKHDIKTFSLEGDFSRNQKLHSTLIKGIPLESNNLLISYHIWDGENSAMKMGFAIYNTVLNKIVKKIVQLDKYFNVRDAASKYDGHFSSSPNSKHIIYACKYYNLYFIFDKSGNFLRTEATFDKVEPPQIISSRQGETVTTRIKSKRKSKYRVSLDSSKVYFLTTYTANGRNPEKNAFIDAYSIKTGAYLYSHKLSQIDGAYPVDFLVNENKIYVIYEEEVIVFSF